MAVVDVKPDWHGFHSETSCGKRTGQAVYTVLFDGNDKPEAMCFLAQTAPGIPRLNSSNPVNRWLYVTNVSARVMEGPLLYEVTVNYEAFTCENSSNAEEPVDPSTIPPAWSYPQAVYTKLIDRDRDGNPITNSAGCSFDNPPTDEFHDHAARVVLYRASYPELLAWEFRGAVNESAWRGFPAEHVLCTVYTADELYTPFGLRYRTTFEFLMRMPNSGYGITKPWAFRYLDEGYEENFGVKDDGTPDIRPIMDDNGVKLTSPQKLDGAGRKLASGAAAVFIERNIKRKMDFAVLGLG